MNISLQNVDKASALISVVIEKSDYLDTVNKSLKTMRQKAQIPGFRTGMVPMNLIQKLYRKSAISEEINKLLLSNLYSYIKENGINVIGEPMPNEEKQQPIDFDTMEDFEFIFDVALMPEFELKISGKDKIDYYEIEVDDAMVDEQIQSFTQRTGKYEQVESSQEKDIIKGLVTELDEQGNTKEGGIHVEDTTLMPVYMTDEEQKALFANSKVNDVVVFNPYKAFGGSEVELSSLLYVEKKETANLQSDFCFQITEITRFVEGELNQKLFDEVFGENNVKTEEEFRERLKSSIANQLEINSKYKFLADARKLMLQKVGDLELSETLIKRLITLSSKDKNENIDESAAEKKYKETVEGLSWHAIREKLIGENNLVVGDSDLLAEAKNMIRTQFAQYGMYHVPEEMLDNYATGMLEKKETMNSLAEKSWNIKLADLLKEKMKVNTKTVSLKEFNELIG